MSDRYVLVHVSDPRVEMLNVRHLNADMHSLGFSFVRVPEDDQLRKDLDRVTEYAIECAQDEIVADIDCGPVGLDINGQWKSFVHDIRRLRAAYGLDQEDE